MKVPQPSQLLNDYISLCGTRTTMEDARTLPERFGAMLDWQGELAHFVIRHPEVLKIGVDKVLEEEEFKRTYLTLKAFGVKS